ncbi:hypothetical protein THAOC_24250, partial [Thalassiosira oceanica]
MGDVVSRDTMILAFARRGDGNSAGLDHPPCAADFDRVGLPDDELSCEEGQRELPTSEGIELDSTEGTESGDGVHSCASTRCSSVPAHCFPSVKCSGSECCKPCDPDKVAGITPPLGGKTLLANDNHDQ